MRILRGFFVAVMMMAALFLTAPHAIAEPAPPPAPITDTAGSLPASIDQIEQKLVHIEVEFSGYAVTEDANGKQQMATKKTKVTQGCSGAFVSPKGDILSADHCFNTQMGREALMQKASMGDMPEEPADPAVPSDSADDPNAVPASPDDPIAALFGPDPSAPKVIDVYGTDQAPPVVANMVGPVPHSDPDMKITVWQRAYMPGAILRKESPVTATLIGSIPVNRGDVAVIRVSLQTPTPFLPIALESPNFDEKIWAAGYDGEAGEFMADDDPMQAAQIVPGWAMQKQPRNMGKPGQEVSTHLGHGMSGGPIVKRGANGQPVIVAVVANGSPDGFFYASDTDAIRRVLTSSVVPFQSEGTLSIATPNQVLASHSSGNVLPVWVTALVAIAGTLLAVGLLYVIRRVRQPTQGRHNWQGHQSQTGVPQDQPLR
jgi:hypothetical protein